MRCENYDGGKGLRSTVIDRVLADTGIPGSDRSTAQDILDPGSEDELGMGAEMKRIYPLDSTIRRENALRAVKKAADDEIIVIQEANRTLDQNRLLWALCGDLSEQAEFQGRRWTPEDWKVFLMSAWRNEVPTVGLRGEPVSLHTSTRKLSKKAFSEFIEFIYAEGVEFGVVWADPTLEQYQNYREAA